MHKNVTINFSEFRHLVSMATTGVVMATIVATVTIVVVMVTIVVVVGTIVVVMATIHSQGIRLISLSR